MLTGAPVVAVSTKMYFGHERGTRWIAEVADRAREHPGIRSGDLQLVVIPGYLQLLPALGSFAGTPVLVGAQDAAETEHGAYTGEVSPAELAEIGVRVVELGHAERRRLYHEDDDLIAAKVAAALRNGLLPLLCVGEPVRQEAETAGSVAVGQLESALRTAPAGPVIVAYEPVWAIGSAEPAPLPHLVAVSRELRRALDARPERTGSALLYGGSAGPGLLTAAGSALDGVFLGRSAHDVDALFEVIGEAAAGRCGAGRGVPS